MLAHIQVAVNQHPQVLLCLAAFQPLFPKPVALHGVVVTQVQDPALSLVEPHTLGPSPSIQPVQVPLQSLPTLKQINTPAQLGVICKLTEGALDPFIQIIDKDIKQNWPQHRALGNTACDRPPTGVNSIHHHSLGPAIQPVLYPAKSTPIQAMSSQFLQDNAARLPASPHDVPLPHVRAALMPAVTLADTQTLADTLGVHKKERDVPGPRGKVFMNLLYPWCIRSARICHITIQSCTCSQAV
ncbi:hypothetical protein QYF61_004796 [Mycteria americana]|uniref:Uncharacterized protein n=1 Tax=Mycteria americana TaxID=33587 RepID=A0AAN7S0X3_MYCAM|nr:hypothetical protein QYF61_004796 [Mycteria americana]